MIAFFSENWAEILLAVVTCIATGLVKYFASQVKNYKKLLDNQEDQEVEKMIENKIAPLINLLNEHNAEYVKNQQMIRQQNEDIQEQFSQQFNRMYSEMSQCFEFIKDFYKYRLLDACQDILQQAYITPSQYEYLSEMYKVYHGLHGNGQAEEKYLKAVNLTIRPDQPEEE